MAYPNRRTGRTAAFGGFLILSACAVQSPRATVASAAAAPVVATASSPATVTDDQAAEIRKYALSVGYQRVTRDGKALWCKRDSYVGSHIITLQCATDAGIRQQELQAQSNKDMIVQGRAACGTCQPPPPPSK